MRPIRCISLLFGLLLLQACAGLNKGPATVQDCPLCPVLVQVPAGQFQMGSAKGEPGRDEGPVHTVRVEKPFWLAATEVTNRQFRAFVAETGHTVAPGCQALDQNPAANWTDPFGGRALDPDEPVVCVSWADTRPFLAWLSQKAGRPYRLPSEAEWEYAARAGGAGDFPWGDDEEESCAYGNVYDAAAAGRFRWPATKCSDGAAVLAKVGSYKPNGFGLYDMVGNVWEWVEDCYVMPYLAGHSTAAPVPPPAGKACEKRGVRGGSWMTRASRNRVAFRGRDPEDARYFMFGFRVARDLMPGEGRR